MDGYEFMYIDRRNKGGGGVPLYVDKDLQFNIVECMWSD